MSLWITGTGLLLWLDAPPAITLMEHFQSSWEGISNDVNHVVIQARNSNFKREKGALAGVWAQRSYHDFSDLTCVTFDAHDQRNHRQSDSLEYI